jgi:peptidoglycan/xylan/chitin deacetylase (PgdA/CDA1 family)
VAVSLVLNIEDGAERKVARGDEADDLGAHWERHTMVRGHPNPTLESAFEYGSRAGIWRVLRTLREFRAPATAFCCAEALALNPAVARALVADGHEIANHGLRWANHTGLSRDEESATMRESNAQITELTGRRPTCWYSRDGISPWTRSTIVVEGFEYDSNSFNDDFPYLVQVGDVTLPVIPYAGDTNDSGLLSVFRSGRAFGSYLCDSLQALSDGDRRGPAVLSVGLHPRLVGRPAFVGGLRTFLAEARGRGLWIATRADIARYWLQRFKKCPSCR